MKCDEHRLQVKKVVSKSQFLNKVRGICRDGENSLCVDQETGGEIEQCVREHKSDSGLNANTNERRPPRHALHFAIRISVSIT